MKGPYCEAWVDRDGDPFFLVAGEQDDMGQPRLAASRDGQAWHTDLGPAGVWSAIAYSRSRNLVVMVSYTGEVALGTPQ